MLTYNVQRDKSWTTRGRTSSLTSRAITWKPSILRSQALYQVQHCRDVVPQLSCFVFDICWTLCGPIIKTGTSIKQPSSQGSPTTNLHSGSKRTCSWFLWKQPSSTLHLHLCQRLSPRHKVPPQQPLLTSSMDLEAL